MSGPLIPGPAAGAGPGTIGTILNRVWAILRGQMRLFLLLSTVPAGVTVLTYALVVGALFAAGILPPHPGQIPDPNRLFVVVFLGILVTTIPLLLVYALLDAAACHAAIRANRGERCSFSEAYGVAWRRAGRYIWLMVLRWLLVALPATVAWGMFAGGLFLSFRGHGAADPPSALLFLMIPVAMLAYALMMVYLVWMALRLGLAMPASLAEDLPAVQSLKRSFQLTLNGFWRIFLVFLVVYAIQYGVVMALEMVAFALGGIGIFAATLLHVSAAVGIGLLIVFGCLFFCAALFLGALSWAAYQITFCVIYDDQRGRMEPATRALGGPA